MGGSFEEVKRKTKIIYNQADVNQLGKIIYNQADVNQLGNKCNIDFCTVDDNVDDIIFVVNEELSLYNLSIHGYLNDRRSRLLPFLLWEQRLMHIQKAIVRSQEGKAMELILIKQAAPCIMHMGNRFGEKQITVLISIAAAKYQCAVLMGLWKGSR